MSRVHVRPLSVLALVILFSATVAWAGPGDVGTPAADFNLLVWGAGTTTQTLSQHAGKVVLLNIIGYG